MLAASISASAVDISVMVVDRDGHGVGEAVVTVTPAAANAGPLPSVETAVMDQHNLAFAPRILVVGVGTTVEFPNNDSVSHQVYSFSATKRFQLPLYKGKVHAPVNFERPGLVVLGCNIHDGMVGYIYVTDAPYFAKTDMAGTVQLKALPVGDYRIAVWSPFIADPPALSRNIRADGNAIAPIRMELRQALRVQPEPRPRRRDWEY